MTRGATASAIGLSIVACSTLSCKGVRYESVFLDSTKQTLPVVTSGAAAQSALFADRLGTAVLSTTWGPGNPLYLVFSALQDFPYSVTDDWSAGVGFSDQNIYKTLWITDKRYCEAKAACSPIAATAIPSPFPFGLTDTYDCVQPWTHGQNGDAFQGAIREVGNVRYGLLTRQDGSTSSMQVLQGRVDTSTSDVLIHYVVGAGTTGSPSSWHFFVEGNAASHRFLMKLYDVAVSGSTVISAVSATGYGISKGAGNYFLFKLRELNGLPPGSETYFCIPATASLADLQALDPNAGQTSAQVSTGPCAGYLSQVDQAGFFWYDDPNSGTPSHNDAPVVPADFNTGNPNQGTVQLFE